MATHSCMLAWKIPWMEEPSRLQSMGLQRVRHDWATSLSLFTFMHWRRKWQPTPVFLPGESQGQGEPSGLLSMGSHRVGHDWSDLAAVEWKEEIIFLVAHVWRAVTCAVSSVFPGRRAWMRGHLTTGLCVLAQISLWQLSSLGSCIQGQAHQDKHGKPGHPRGDMAGSVGCRKLMQTLTPLQWTSKHVFLTWLDTSRTVDIATLSQNSARE